MIERRFILRVSVGLIVLAPRPVACEEWWAPGIIETRLLLEDGVLRRPPTRGDRGVSVECRFCSGVRVLPKLRFPWPGRGGGCTDLDLAALELGKPLALSSHDVLPSKETLAEAVDAPSDRRLGRLFWAVRGP